MQAYKVKEIKAMDTSELLGALIRASGDETQQAYSNHLKVVKELANRLELDESKLLKDTDVF